MVEAEALQSVATQRLTLGHIGHYFPFSRVRKRVKHSSEPFLALINPSRYGGGPFRPMASYCSLPSLSFGQALGKLQGKVVTQSEEVGWWRTLMVECVTLF